MGIDRPIQYFTQNIRYLRRKHQLTQDGMAKIMGISASTLRRLENNDPHVKIHCVMLTRTCDHFDISADVMLKGYMGE